MQQDEGERLRALNDLGLLNTAPSESFDRITRMASQIFGAPIAAVSLTDKDRQWFKSRVGCGTEIPRDRAPCAEVTRLGDVLVVSDLSQDPRFKGNVLDQSGVRFYAGAPLTTRDGFTLGAMCVLDTKPRTITPEQARILTDLAAMVMAQVELQHALGRIDPASGLPNRNQFAEDLEDLSRDHAGQERIAMLVDLVEPVQLNQSMRILGPAYLDTMIKTAAGAIKERLKGEATLYQVGVTQFATVLVGHNPQVLFDQVQAHFAEVAETALGRDRAASAPVVGLMPFRLGEVSPAQVLRAALGAAQDARDAGKSVGLYSVALDDAHQRRYALLDGLHDALLAPDQLSLHFQPRIDLRTGRCDGVEALLRWQHPALGNVAPGEFIPLAEATELARPLTQWVIEAALQQAAVWRAAGLELKISVNVSPANLEEADFAERMGEALARYAVPAQALEVEFTESGLIRNQGRILINLAAIRALGIACAIDDFGTGYSSFSYLKDIPAEIIKIDQSFIRTLVPGGADSALVRGMITMAQELGLRVVAEGVETQLAYDFLCEAGCDEAQGYLISRPVPAPAFTAWLHARDPGTKHHVAA
ncbi:GGDEF and EAL domain-containing protein [Devosia sp. 1566]|uniref:sensor domain-containing phosphodiesterase n=1 Tax=Devosia sp. 1566 TaxID=2499144 RepID=UPI000FD77F54|nr:GGDEF and EAL domain-containing protein [Devosia sp. 1566]